MKSVTPKVFLDSNIFFSAFYGSVNCERLIKAHQKGEIIATISQQVIEESTINIREKIPQMLTSFERLLINNLPELVVDPKIIPSKITQFVDVKDQPIFASAMLAKVDYFVTGNIKDFKVKELEKDTGIKILTSKQLVERLNLK